MLIKYIPYDRLTIETHMSAENAASIMRSHIRNRIWIYWVFPMYTGDGSFEGKVTNTGFRISRKLPRYYRNSSLPTLYGKFEQKSMGLNIHVWILLNPLVYLILLFVFSVIFYIGIYPEMVKLITTGEINDNLYGGIFFILAIYLVIQIVYSYEITRAREFLFELYGNRTTKGDSI